MTFSQNDAVRRLGMASKNLIVVLAPKICFILLLFGFYSLFYFLVIWAPIIILQIDVKMNQLGLDMVTRALFSTYIIQ